MTDTWVAYSRLLSLSVSRVSGFFFADLGPSPSGGGSAGVPSLYPVTAAAGIPGTIPGTIGGGGGGSLPPRVDIHGSLPPRVDIHSSFLGVGGAPAPVPAPPPAARDGDAAGSPVQHFAASVPATVAQTKHPSGE